MNNDDESNKAFYIRTWRLLLLHLLGWPEVAIDKWLHRMQARFDLDDPEAWVYHEFPVRWVVPTIIRERFGGDLSDDDRTTLLFRLLDALEYGRVEIDESTDWDTYRSHVRHAIAEFEAQSSPGRARTYQILREARSDDGARMNVSGYPVPAELVHEESASKTYRPG